MKSKTKTKTQSQNNDNKKNIEFIGNFSLGQTEKIYNAFNPKETKIDHSSPKKHITITDFSKPYFIERNPYDKMVNLSMITHNSNKISFETKSLYNKAVELSLNPKNAKMDKNNPIFYFIANSNES